MFWTWNAVIHVILLQAALAFYVLVWPVLRETMVWTSRRLSRFAADEQEEETAQTHREHPYRGKWRDTQYQRAERADRTQWQEHKKRRNASSHGVGPEKAKHLRVLGLSEPVHLLDIKSAYRQLAKDFHPDKFASDHHGDKKRAAAAARMREVNTAYDWLRSNA